METPQRFTLTHWLIVTMAAIGFAFDIYELLMLPLIAGPALNELMHITPADPEFKIWTGYLLFIPALAGGVFGLLGGYLTDLFGRRRVLVWSILIYAFSAFFAGFSTSIGMFLFLRCTTFIGVCVEFVAAVAWLAELFPEPKQRERVLGYTQAFSSFGGLMVNAAFGLSIYFADDLPSIVLPEFFTSTLGQVKSEHAPWRYTLMSGLIPAIPLLVLRPFMPESPAWHAKKAAGTLKRPSFLELFRPEFRRTTIITALMVACSYGVAFGAIQQVPQIVPALPQVQAEVKDLDMKEKRTIIEQRKKTVQDWQEYGGLVGRCILAFLAIRIVSRQRLLRIFLIPGALIVPLVFFIPAVSDLEMLKYGIFLVGLCTVSQFSFWGNYLPRVFPVHLRGTGESFAANVGGRIVGTSAAMVTTFIAANMDLKWAYAAGLVGTSIYVFAIILSFWLPEPKQEMLGD